MTGAGAVEFCFVREAAATRGIPELLLRRLAERRKAEENSLADFSWVRFEAGFGDLSRDREVGREGRCSGGNRPMCEVT